MDTQTLSAESGGDGGSSVRMHDVGPAPRALPIVENDIPPTPSASYWVSPRIWHIPTVIVLLLSADLTTNQCIAPKMPYLNYYLTYFACSIQTTCRGPQRLVCFFSERCEYSWRTACTRLNLSRCSIGYCGNLCCYPLVRPRFHLLVVRPGTEYMYCTKSHRL